MLRRIAFLLLLTIIVTSHGQEYNYTTYTYFSNDTISLELDLFLPDSAEVTSPLVIFVHGGGFASGKRSNGHPFCQFLAENGVSAATISYSLSMKGKKFSCNGNLTEKIRTIHLAAFQTRIATQWMISHSDAFGIDTSKIFLAGSSAGAEAILQAVFWDRSADNYFPDILSETFKYMGAISGAGALLDINMIHHGNKIPLLSYHGTCDPLVPYYIAPHHYCSQKSTGYMILFGSLALHQRLLELNESSQLMTYCGDGHQHSGTPFYGDEISTVLEFIGRTIHHEKFNVHRIHNRGMKCETFLGVEFCD